MPPWLVRFMEDLEDDGIQSEEDIRFISDELFELWEHPAYHEQHVGEGKHRKAKMVYHPDGPPSASDDAQGASLEAVVVHGDGRPRYPLVVLRKLRELRDAMQAAKRKTKTAAPSQIKLEMKATTLNALKKRGVGTQASGRAMQCAAVLLFLLLLLLLVVVVVVVLLLLVPLLR